MPDCKLASKRTARLLRTVMVCTGAALLVACGGDGPAGPPPAAAPPAAISVALDAGVVLDWIEFKVPDLFVPQTRTLLRTGPSEGALRADGLDFSVRAYAHERYLAIASNGGVFGLGDFTAGQVMGFGTVDDWAVALLADARPQTVSVMLVSDLGPGESFRFTLGPAVATVTAKGQAVAFASTLYSGTAYRVAQTDGPRSCVASANSSGMVGFRDIVVTMDCGRPPGQSLLSGQLHAPVGTVVTLQLNGGADLTLTMPAFAGAADPYNLLPFVFGAALPDGAAYQVTLKSAPADQVCSVYKGATGTMPLALGGLRVGCEWRADLVSRSTDNQSRGNFFNSRDLVVGGAAGPVGRTLDGYGEGRFVAFVTYAPGLGGSTGRHRQVFWRDRLTGQTLMVSVNASGEEGNDESLAPAISADGLTVSFESYATNLSGTDGNTARDVFVWSANNRQLGARRVSVGPGGVEANAESFEPTLSGDGRWLAFSTSASNLTPGVVGTATVNVVLRDLDSGSNTLVTANARGQGVGGSRPMLSESGARLAYTSVATDLVAGDSNGLWDVFVYDTAAGTQRRVSLTTGGGERNQGIESASRVVAPAISGNGRYVAWATTATNVVGGDSNGVQDLFVTDLDSGAVQWASLGVGGAAGNADSPVGQGERVSLSHDGRWVAFTTAATNLGVQAGQVVLRNLDSGETRAIATPGGTPGFVSVSRNAAYVAFGHSNRLDPRWPASGLFVELTGLGRPWWWFD
jgi:Tol biopolymer transport system component